MAGSRIAMLGQHIGGTQNCSGWRRAPSSHITTMHHKHSVLAIYDFHTYTDSREQAKSFEDAARAT